MDRETTEEWRTVEGRQIMWVNDEGLPRKMPTLLKRLYGMK